jgi:hypothetical protein
MRPQPCHRMLDAGSVETKLKLLRIEGAKVGESPALFGDLPQAVRPTR